jgi:hypothetical protein
MAAPCLSAFAFRQDGGSLLDNGFPYIPPGILLDPLFLLEIQPRSCLVDRLVQSGANDVHIGGRRSDIAIGRTRQRSGNVPGGRRVTGGRRGRFLAAASMLRSQAIGGWRYRTVDLHPGDLVCQVARQGAGADLREAWGG